MIIPEILKTAGQIAGIGGLSLAVLLILFREIIRKAIFPQLPKKDAYKLLRMIILLTFIITVIGMGGWFYVDRASKTIQDATTLLAEFELDKNGEPLFILDEDEAKHYQIRLSVKNVPPDVTSVTYIPWDGSFRDRTYTSDTGPDFKLAQSEFTSFGDIQIQITRRAQGSRDYPKKIFELSSALEQNYTGKVNPKIRDAIAQIKAK